jgi:hypothetical protein
VQQEEAGVDSERWPNRVITAARQIQTTEPSLLSRISSKFDARHGASVSFNKRTITYKGVKFTLQNVNGKLIIVCSSKTVSGAAMRAIAAEFQEKLQEKLGENGNFAGNKLTITTATDGNVTTIVFPREIGEAEIIKLQADRSGNLVISPQALGNPNSAESKFMTQLSQFGGKEFEGLHRQLTRLKGGGPFNPDKDHQTFQLDSDNLWKAVELLENPVEVSVKPAADDGGNDDPQGLLQSAMAIIKPDDDVSTISTAGRIADVIGSQQAIFAEAKAKLLAPYLGGRGEGESADIFLRAIQLAKNKDNVSEVFGIYKSLGGEIPENMTESSLALLLRIGRDILALAKWDNANSNAKAPLGRLISQLAKQPIAIQKEAGSAIVTLFGGYANAEQEIDCKTTQIPQNALTLTLSNGKFESGAAEISGTRIASGGDIFVPSIDLLMGGQLRVFAGASGTEATDKGEAWDGNVMTLQPAPIAERGWERHKANGNCAIYAIHDSAQQAGLISNADTDNEWQREGNYQNLRNLAKDKALENFRALCPKGIKDNEDRQPDINADVFLGAAYAVAAGKGLIRSGQGHFMEQDMLEIANLYNQNYNSNEQIGHLTPRIRALCDVAFHAITLGTDQSWVDIESMKYLAQALGKQIVVVDAQSGDQIGGYRIFQPDGGCFVYGAEQNCGIGKFKYSNGEKSQTDEKTLIIDDNPIVIVKTANHYLGISEVRVRANAKNPIKLPNGNPLKVPAEGDNDAWIKTMFHLDQFQARAAVEPT